MKIIAAVIVGIAAIVAVPLVAIGVAFGGQLGQLVSQEPPSVYAESVLPAVAIRAFEQSAEQCVGIPWQVLAAVNLTFDPKVMTEFNKSTGAINAMLTSTDADNELGPMGFSLQLWQTYAEVFPGAPSDAMPDPMNEYDAIFTLGRVLCAFQTTAGDVDDTLTSYNASPEWVSQIMSLAMQLGMNADGTTTDITGSGTPPSSGTATGASGYLVSYPPGISFNGAGAELVAAAETQLGVPYVWGGITANVALDCSGLVVVGMQALGFNLLWDYRTSQEQATLGVTVAPTALQPGDLLFFEGEDITGPSLLGHVAVYVGSGEMIEAPQTGEVVRFSAVPWSSIELARRVLSDVAN